MAVLLHCFVLVALFAGSASVAAQRSSEQGQAIDRAASERVAALTARLKYRADDRADQDRYYDELDAVTRELRQAVDGYIERVAGAAKRSEEMEQRLRKLLALHRPNPEYGDLAIARFANLRAGRGLLVAYTLVRPPHHDTATIRGYRQATDGFRLVAATGEDFDGYNMFKRQLPAPIDGETWLLAWGQAHTFNGSLVRLRLYSFDGEAFTTRWRPADLLSATVSFTPRGFVVDHQVRQPPYSLRQEYALSAAGPVRIK
jgi:hypothetical protein